MTRLESEPDVRALAAELGMAAKADPVRWVVDYCLARVSLGVRRRHRSQISAILSKPLHVTCNSL